MIERDLIIIKLKLFHIIKLIYIPSGEWHWFKVHGLLSLQVLGILTHVVEPSVGQDNGEHKSSVIQLNVPQSVQFCNISCAQVPLGLIHLSFEQALPSSHTFGTSVHLVPLSVHLFYQ